MLYKDKSLQIVITCISLIQIKVPLLFVFKSSSDSLRLNTYCLVYNISDDGCDCSGDCMLAVHTICNVWIFISSNPQTSFVLL